MAPKNQNFTVVGRIVPAVTMFTLGKILALPQVRKATERMDKKAAKRKERVVSSLGRAGQNAMSNKGWLAAGAAAFAVGIGLMAKASKSK